MKGLFHILSTHVWSILCNPALGIRLRTPHLGFFITSRVLESRIPVSLRPKKFCISLTFSSMGDADLILRVGPLLSLPSRLRV
ncbi:hypothetical protein ATANTOWER_006947 [Ataeniobius toweri]|uniref:Uncharacterized protein n=1 Tax=Ataeniobius toweri TaxID=208326 RepID=A0ABU7AFS4_9TELE|nr:hypothetical protein [Ataeniobius toweri]